MVTKVRETLSKHKEGMGMSALIATLISALLGTGAYTTVDNYVGGVVEQRVSEHMESVGHLSPELIAAIKFNTEEDLVRRIDELTRIQCDTGADLREEIRAKRKQYRKITGDTYRTKSCDEVS